MKRLFGFFFILSLIGFISSCCNTGCDGKATGTITGTVLDVNNFPVPGANVIISSDQVTVVTDSNGQFTATVTAGKHTLKVFIEDMRYYSGTIYLKANTTTSIAINTPYSLWATVTPKYVIIDDYNGVSLPDREWYYSRIGTDRGGMGDGNIQVNIGGGNASVTVISGWAGVWTSLIHNVITNDELDPTQILGPYIRSQYQPRITGVELELSDGAGLFKVELKDLNGQLIAVKEFVLNSGQQTLHFAVEPETGIKRLNWLVDGSGNATVEEVRVVIDSPGYLTPEAVFLFSYGHLSQCYDPSSGLVRDRARWPVEDFASVQTVGTFALSTAIAHELGYIDENTARNIIITTRDVILSLNTYHGLLPHFVANGEITENTEWSSVDTVIALVSEILACQAIGEDTSLLEAMLRDIDWDDLTNSGTQSISQGYDYSGNKLDAKWDTFGSEAFLVAVAYAAATGKADVKLDKYSYPPTWDGSGFNDELAALFFPMESTDTWGNDWAAYRSEAFEKQVNYFSGHEYEGYGLFGLSASEVPEPWSVSEDKVYGAWGVGGHNGQANDGTSIAGYPVIAPHYASLIAKNHPYEFEEIFLYLIEKKGIFTPLNNIESLGIDNDGNLRWNSLKGSWNLSLQALGVSRVLSRGDYLPYRALTENDFLYKGFKVVMDLN